MKKVTKGSKNRLEKELGFRSFGKSLCVSLFSITMVRRRKDVCNYSDSYSDSDSD